MKKKVKRKSGAQKNNRNALKHGFYSKVFTEAERIDLYKASGIEGIDEEIALLRLEIKNAIAGGKERNLLLLIKAAGALDKLIRTRYQITSAERKGIKEAIDNIVQKVLIPFGITIGSAAITRALPGD